MKFNEATIRQTLTELRAVPVFSDFPEEDLLWLINQSELQIFNEGDVIFREQDTADSMMIALEGEVHVRVESDPSDPFLYVGKKGEVTGKLPYSRMTHWGVTGRAAKLTKILKVSTTLFPEIGRRMPVLIERLVGVMSDRIRYITKEDLQRDRLAALGKLSAGLAHELNNPAAAAKRSALALSETQEAIRHAVTQLDHMDLSTAQRTAISTFERRALQHVLAAPPLDSLIQSELEDEVTTWLEEHRVPEGWKMASTIVEADLDVEWLNQLAEGCGQEALPHALNRIVCQILAKRLASEVETSAGRISELVKAIKEYSYMDQAPIQEIDIHQGIESTLVMLNYKLKHGIKVERSFDKKMPPVCAFGSELNQVWTNLIDNAADAMPEGGKLNIRTSREREMILVEITDTGHGIPKEILGRIFEPFFTTKKLGQGTGLGLDTVYRIIRKHHGDIHVDSQPGETRFSVRLPIEQPRKQSN